jgi:hypothetical protein
MLLFVIGLMRLPYFLVVILLLLLFFFLLQKNSSRRNQLKSNEDPTIYWCIWYPLPNEKKRKPEKREPT